MNIAEILAEKPTLSESILAENTGGLFESADLVAVSNQTDWSAPMGLDDVLNWLDTE